MLPRLAPNLNFRVQLLTLLAYAVILFSACQAPLEKADGPLDSPAAFVNIVSDTESAREAQPVVTAPLMGDPDEMKITAVTESPEGASVNTAFLIENLVGNAETLQQRLRMAPAVDFSLSKQSSDSWLLTPAQKLGYNTVYSISLDDRNASSWAFQTAGNLYISSMLPGYAAQEVPVDSGIEITFSRSDVPSPEPFFSIQPAVKGRFEKHDATWVFVPEALEEATTYTVSLSAELAAADGEKLGTEYSYSFATIGSEGIADIGVAMNIHVESFAYGDPVILEFYYYPRTSSGFTDQSDFLASPPLDVLLETYPLSPEQYRQMLDAVPSNYGAWPHINTEDLTLGETFRLEALPIVTSYGAAHHYVIHIPDVLSQGHYLLQVTLNPDMEARQPLRFQKLVQLHPYCLYTLSSGKETLLWVNDTATGLPVVDALVQLGQTSAQTDSSGVAKLDLLHENRSDGRAFFSVAISTAQAIPYIDRIEASGANSYLAASAQKDYFTLLYLDRAAYQPDDIIKFWGVVLPRHPGVTIPQNVELRVLGHYYATANATPSIWATPNAQGHFSGSFPLSKYQPSDSSISLILEDEICKSVGFTVSNYSKPLYLLQAQSSQAGYFAGDAATLPVSASFYDGTPAQGVGLSLGSFYGEERLYATADAEGQAEFTQKAIYYIPWSYPDWRPSRADYTLAITEVETEIVTQPISYWVFPTDLMLLGRATPDEQGHLLEIETHRIDLDRFNQENSMAYSYNTDSIKGPAVSQELQVRVVAVDYVKTPIGNRYDYLNKQTITLYEYSLAERQLANYTVQSDSEGVAKLSLPTPYRADGYYYAEISAVDSRGYLALERVYLYENPDYRYSNPDTPYRRFFLKTDTQFSTWYRNIMSLKLHETTEFQLMEGVNPVPEGKGRLLQVRLFDSELNYTQSGPRFDFTFEKDDLPNVSLYTAYFDGRHIFPVESYYHIQLNPEDYKLNIDVEIPGGPYRPGETAEVHLRITDFEGHPRAASGVLSVVDEAVFAIREQTIETVTGANGLYNPLYHPYAISYTSYIQHVEAGYIPGGKGGDGSGVFATGARRDFRDTAAFIPFDTDESGEITIPVKLPDNATTWRLTALAVSQESDLPHAGYGILRLPASLPFFILEINQKTLVVGDDLVVSLRGKGRALTEKTFVDYTATLEGPQGFAPLIRSGSADANEQLYLSFGQLPEGDYTLNLRGNCGELYDELSKSISVVASRLELPISEDTSVQDLAQLVAVRSPLRLTFYDARVYPWLRSLDFLQSSWSNRSDQRLCREMARSMRDRYNGVPNTDAPFVDAAAFQGVDFYSNGGIRLLPYGEADAELTARFCLAAPQIVSRPSLQMYSRMQQPQTTHDRILQLLIQACIKEPVLAQLTLLAENPSELDLQDQLYLCLALAEIGDSDNARRLYLQLTRERLFAQGPWVFLDSGIDADHTLKYTALCMQIALRLKDAQAESLLRYLLENSSEEITVDLEILDYAWRMQPNYEDPAVFSYLENGVRREIVLEHGVFGMTVNREQLETADFAVLKGQVGVRAFYMATPTSLFTDEQQQLSLSKSNFTPQVGTARPGDLVAIQIQPEFGPDAPEGDYRISDVIPSGMRYAGFQSRQGIYLLEQDDQSVAFSYHRDAADDAPLIYYVRCLLPGEYLNEAAFIRHDATGLWGSSPPGSVKIEDGSYATITQ